MFPARKTFPYYPNCAHLLCTKYVEQFSASIYEAPGVIRLFPYDAQWNRSNNTRQTTEDGENCVNRIPRDTFYLGQVLWILPISVIYITSSPTRLRCSPLLGYCRQERTPTHTSLDISAFKKTTTPVKYKSEMWLSLIHI